MGPYFAGAAGVVWGVTARCVTLIATPKSVPKFESKLGPMFQGIWFENLVQGILQNLERFQKEGKGCRQMPPTCQMLAAITRRASVSMWGSGRHFIRACISDVEAANMSLLQRRCMNNGRQERFMFLEVVCLDVSRGCSGVCEDATDCHYELRLITECVRGVPDSRSYSHM